MLDCYTLCYETGKEYAGDAELPSLAQGANIAGKCLVCQFARAAI